MVMGVLPDFRLKESIRKGIINSTDSIEEKDQIQPSSIDLRIGTEFFCMPHSSLPCVRDLNAFLNDAANYQFNIDHHEGYLHKGSVYVVKLKERLKLPEHIEARANPKSSIGRTDIHVRLLTCGGRTFDNVPAGYQGDLWLEICPKSFDIRVKEGMAMNQLRLFDSGTKDLDSEELISLHRDEGILYVKRKKMTHGGYKSNIQRNGVVLGINLEGKCAGYVARKDAPSVDLSKRDHPVSSYFQPVPLTKEGVVIQENSFYIFNSLEEIMIPDGVCGEMADIDTGSGEFRAHYAGFFDPGFNAPAVLEVRNFGQPFLLRHGQGVAAIRFQTLKDKTERPYGSEGRGSHYQGQKGPRLAKYFDRGE